MSRLAVFSLLALTVVGCKGSDDDLEPAFVPKNHTFEGEVAPNFVGKWKTEDGVSTLDLGRDGVLKVQTVTPSPSGKRTSTVDGQWRVSSGNLLMQYRSESGGSTVLKYAAQLANDSMTLQPEAGKAKKVYHRK